MAGLADAIIEMLNGISKATTRGVDEFPKGGGAFKDPELVPYGTVSENTDIYSPQWDRWIKKDPLQPDADNPNQNSWDWLHDKSLGGGVANQNRMNPYGYGGFAGTRQLNIPPIRNKHTLDDTLNALSPVAKGWDVSDTYSPWDPNGIDVGGDVPFYRKVSGTPQVSKNFKDIRNDPANENIADQDAFHLGDDWPQSHQPALQENQIMHLPNDVATQSINERYGTRFVSAGSEEGYKQLDEALNQLGISLGLNKKGPDAFKALGHNRLIIAKDQQMNPSYGGIFFQDGDAKTPTYTIGLPTTMLEGRGGSLAHEWAHSFDKYLFDEFKMGNPKPYTTHDLATMPQNRLAYNAVRSEVWDAWKQVHALINDTNNPQHQIAELAGDNLNPLAPVELDNPVLRYFSSSHEKFARYFSEWAASKHTNPNTDLLFHTPEEYKNPLSYNLSSMLNDPNADDLVKSQALEYKQKIFAAFDHLFDVLQPEKTMDANGKPYWRLAGLAGLTAGAGLAAGGQAQAQDTPQSTNLLDLLDPKNYRDFSDPNTYVDKVYTKSHGVPLFGAGTAYRRSTDLMGNSLSDAINQVSMRYGITADALRKTAMIESSGGRNKSTSSAGAQGSFQFTSDTAKQYGLTDPNDDYAATDAAARLWLDNKKALARSLGREPTDAEVYLAHQQGAAGAAKLLGNPNELASRLVGIKAVIQNGGSADMSGADFANLWIKKYNSLN